MAPGMGEKTLHQLFAALWTPQAQDIIKGFLGIEVPGLGYLW